MADTVKTPEILTRAQTIRARVSKPTPELWVNDVLFLLDTNEAMEAILLLLELGLARIEPETDEFCFAGLRYSIGKNRDWRELIRVIGWKLVRESIDKAEGRL